MQKHKEIFESNTIGQLLLKMSIPATIGMLVNALYNLVDTIFVGRWVGPLGIGGLTIALPVQVLIGALGMTFGMGAASIISRRLGEKKPEDAARAAVASLTLSLIFSVLLFIVGEIFIDPLLKVFGATDTILPYAREYLRIILLGAYFLSTAMVGNNLLRAEGQPMMAMLSMIIGAGLNCLLDPIFIYVLHLGIRGAALATIISQFASYCFIMFFLLTGKSHLPLKLKHLKLKIQLVNEIFILGMPTFVRQAGIGVLALALNNVLKFYGGDMGIASYGLINRLFMFCLLPIFGIVQGYQPIAGYSFGARQIDRLGEVNKKALFTTTAMSFGAFFILEILARVLISIFTKDKELIATAVPALRTASLGIGFLGMQVVGSTYFLSIGKAFPAFFLGLSRQFLILLPLVILLPRFFGLAGVWFAIPLADIFSTIITMIWFSLSWSGIKRKNAEGLLKPLPDISPEH